jgi:hypothetical protein
MPAITSSVFNAAFRFGLLHCCSWPLKGRSMGCKTKREESPHTWPKKYCYFLLMGYKFFPWLKMKLIFILISFFDTYKSYVYADRSVRLDDLLTHSQVSEHMNGGFILGLWGQITDSTQKYMSIFFQTLCFLWRRAPQQKLRTHRSLEAYCATLWWRWRERWSLFFFIFPSNGAPVEWNWQGKTEVLGEKSVPVPLCPPQIPHGLTRDRTPVSAVGGQRLTAWAMSRPFKPLPPY